MEHYALAVQVFGAGLVFARVGALVFLLPGVGESAVPAPVRLGFALLLALVVAAALVAGVGLRRPDHRPSPVWNRAAAIAAMLLVISLVPLALAVAGVFGLLHGLGA